MPNGKIGDHPLTDILIHGCSDFGPQIDSVVRELAAMPSFDKVRDRVANLLWDNWSLWGEKVTRDLQKVSRELAQIKAEIGGDT